MINWVKYKNLYFIFSSILVVIGIYSLVNWGLIMGVDFRGGTIAEYKFTKSITISDITDKLTSNEIEVISIQESGEKTFFIKMAPLASEDKEKLKSTLLEFDPDLVELRYETVGPSIGPELIKKTIYALSISIGLILLWIAYQFRSLKFGVSAIIAMLHDSFILVAFFSVLGHFYQVEIDFLFVTALLTTLSFSVHDTIVVFDRIREIMKKEGGEIIDVSNKALTETMVRSLNNSFTIMFMLLALVLMGGETVKWFAVALLIGTIFGTYSSPFIAVPLLNVWEDISLKIRKR